MTLFRTVDPAVEPVTLIDAKAHLRIAHTSEDDLLSGLIRAARDDIEKSTGIALIAQTWRLALDDWPSDGRILLRRFPVNTILTVTAYDLDGTPSIVDSGTYQLDPLSRPARLHIDERPERLRAMNGIEVDFTAGFGESGADVPDLMKRAMLMLVAHWYEFRAQFDARQHPVSYPLGYDRMIAGYKTRRL